MSAYSALTRQIIVFVGCKTNNIAVVYTPFENLKKTPAMEVGQVGFHNQKKVCYSLQCTNGS